MAISLQDLRTTRADRPPRVLIYGPPKIGKTTLASEFPSPVFLKVEDGDTADVELTGWEISSYGQALEAVTALYDEHDFRTVVIDSLSRLEPMIWAEVCRRKGWSSIEDAGYGKGYVEADLLWQECMQALSGLRRKRDMAVVLIAHSEVKRVEDPVNGPLDRYQVQLHKRALDVIYKECDVICFVNYRVAVVETKGAFNRSHRKGVGSGERVMHFADRPGFMAGNRYSMDDEIPYRRGSGFQAIAEYMPVISSFVTKKEAA